MGGVKYFPSSALIGFALWGMDLWNAYYRILEAYFVIFWFSGRGAIVSIEKISNTGRGFWVGGAVHGLKIQANVVFGWFSA